MNAQVPFTTGRKQNYMYNNLLRIFFIYVTKNHRQIGILKQCVKKFLGRVKSVAVPMEDKKTFMQMSQIGILKSIL